MTGRRRRDRAQAPIADDRAHVLCLLVRCERLLVAIPAAQVVRIVLARDAIATVTPGGIERVRDGDLIAPAWRLGDLLGIETPIVSWAFLGDERRGVTAGGGGAPQTMIALGTGPCMAVRPMRAPEPLPIGLFQGRDAPNPTILGAFRVDDAMLARGSGIVGVWIDPVPLFAAGPS